MRIYISGPMTGIPNFNRAAFKDAQITLEAMGHEVFNPGHNPKFRTRRQYLEAELGWICRKAEGMVLLFGWVRSSGAFAELATAKAIGIPVWYEYATESGKFVGYVQRSPKGETLFLEPAA